MGYLPPMKLLPWLWIRWPCSTRSGLSIVCISHGASPSHRLIIFTSTCWRNDHNGFSHQGPGFIDNLVTKKPSVVRIYLRLMPIACFR